MSLSAVVLMIVAMLVIWGGLLAAVIHLRNATQPGDASFHRDL